MIFWLILAMAAITFGTRLAGFVLVRNVAPDGWFARWLHYVPIAIFAAIIGPGALAPRGTLEAGPNVVAALAALVTGLWTRNILATLAAGMGVFWLLQALGA